MAVYISDQVPELLVGDPGRFRQIITNLMGNSIKVSLHLQNQKVIRKKGVYIYIIKFYEISFHFLILRLKFKWTKLLLLYDVE